jgi:hypothetical protein
MGDERQAYSVPAALGRGNWALGGEWAIHRQSVDLHEAVVVSRSASTRVTSTS